MAVDTWNSNRESVSERATGVVRFAVVAFVWMAVVAGPPIIGGLLGWMVTRDMVRPAPVGGLLGQLPAEVTPVLVTREEVEAVGLDPSDVRAILSN